MEEIKVGMKAPDFSLDDFRGNPFILSDYKGRSQVMLTLLRGFDCPNSRRHLDTLRSDFPKFLNLNTILAVVGQHSRDEFAGIWKMFSLPFAGLPDNREMVAKLYHQKIMPKKLGKLPAIFLIDPFGFITYARYGEDISDFPANENLFPFLEKNNSDFQFSFGPTLPRHDHKEVSLFT